MRFTSVPLDRAHNTTEFRCGEESLDSWLVENAHTEVRRGTARVWVWLDATGGVVAYYSLSASKVGREDVPTKLGRGGSREIPAVLLGRLALDRTLRGQTLGEVLLADALSRIVEATRTVGARLVVVDALHEKAAVFYEKYGFRRIPGSLRLVQRVADIAASHDEP